jgi:hypothetical protein
MVWCEGDLGECAGHDAHMWYSRRQSWRCVVSGLERVEMRGGRGSGRNAATTTPAAANNACR